MKVTIPIIIFLLLLTSNFSFAQTFEKKFSGCWASTTWAFEFYKTGKYKRTSTGHYGYTTVEGHYLIKNDTLNILSGYEDTNGTVNEKYIIDSDSILIDLRSGYGYPLATKKYADTTYTAYCGIKYPMIQSVKPETEKLIEEALNLAFNSDVLKQFFQFDKYPQRKLIVANYYKLKAKIQVGEHEVIFTPKDKIKDDFYVEFTHIDESYNRVSFDIWIPKENTTIWFRYEFENGQWKADIPFVRKKDASPKTAGH